MRKTLAVLILGLAAAIPAAAAVNVSIGINVPTYPVLQRIPSYPVYYAPNLRANYFFYDGLYWVFNAGEWYASSWYNGPWYVVDRYEVPVYLLRVPVRYYRYAPATFRSWRVDAAPRWNVYWGDTWASRRSGWDRYDIRRAPAPAPLPVYQRSYSRDNYPRVEQQAVISSRSYGYQPREAAAREVVRERRALASREMPAADIQRRIDARDRQLAAQRDREVIAQSPERRVQPEQARARGQERDERGMPEQAQGRARGHDRDERGIPAHAQGQARGHDRDDDSDRGQGHGRGRGHDKD